MLVLVNRLITSFLINYEYFDMNDENKKSSDYLGLVLSIQKELKESGRTLMRINKLNIELVERVDTLTVSVRWVSLWLLVSIILFASFYFWEVENLIRRSCYS